MRKEGVPYNVILISFDTMRRDYLHCYGHPKELSPHLDEMGKEGVVFEDAVVNCGWTLPQHITLLTGLHPIKHRLIYLRRKCFLSRRFRTLAEIFQSQGYLTFGFCNQNGYGGGWQYGFYRGMRTFTTAFPYNNMMEQVVEPVVWALRLSGTAPFFIYIHTNDTHEPFSASEPFGSMWGSSYQNRYEGEITYVDHYFGEILKALKKLGLEDRTLVVATSDHGTEFREHGFLEKKLNLYEEISEIPLIMKLPGVIPQGRRVSGICETIDVAPTILDICGLDIPEEMDGKSLLKRVQGKRSSPPKYSVAHTLHEQVYLYEHFSIRTERYKLIRTVPLTKKPEVLKDKWSGDAGHRFERLASVAVNKAGTWWELYDLKNDPKETKNLFESRPAVASKLNKKLTNFIKRYDYRPYKPPR